MELLILIIPIITVIILVTKFRENTAFWEYLLVVIPTLLLFVILKYSMIYCNSLDTEYQGDLIDHITYYEDWDETVMVTHTRQVPCGTDSKGHIRYRTETYTVPERRYHPEVYEYTTITGNTLTVNYDSYKHIISKLNVSPVFKDMHRNYRSKDGDAYVYTWNRTRENSYPITTDHFYTNKVKASSYSIFKYSSMSDEEIKDAGLYEYPEIKMFDQNPILGYSASYEDNLAVRYLNGYRGPKNQFRMFILCFDNPSLEVAEMQKAYWQGGNKNELVVCLGIQGDSVIWCNPFSWCDEPLMEVKVRDYFIKNPHINFKDFAEYVDINLDDNWKRKQFEDFDYISIECSTGEYVFILILILLYNIGISYWVITNEYDEKNPKGKNRRYGSDYIGYNKRR